jgi:hypothetical protein
VRCYTVDWDPAAENELAEIWTEATDRAAVTRAQQQADQILSRNPIDSGIELSEGLHRILV